MQELEPVQSEPASADMDATCEAPPTSVAFVDAASVSAERRDRARQNLLGLAAAFGRFAFTLSKPRTPRHADTWRDKGPHESGGAARRRLRQLQRQARGVTLGPVIEARDIPY